MRTFEHPPVSNDEWNREVSREGGLSNECVSMDVHPYRSIHLRPTNIWAVS
jgi:hypothetical protein